MLEQMKAGLPEKQALMSQVEWLLAGHSGPEKRRLEKGMEVAWTAIAEAGSLADFIDSSDFTQTLNTLNVLRPRDSIIAGRISCIDGRNNGWPIFLARAVSVFPAVAGLIASKRNLSGEMTRLSSTQLALALEEVRRSGRLSLESIEAHTSLTTDHICGGFALWFQENGWQGIKDKDKLPDKGLAVDLTRQERRETRSLLERKGAVVIQTVRDTDTQGVVFLGDDLHQALADSLMIKGKYSALDKEAILREHRRGSLIYTPELVKEFNGWLAKSGFSPASIRWESVADLPANTENIVGLTAKIVSSAFGTEIKKRLAGMYQSRFVSAHDRSLAEKLIQELTVKVAYNTASVYLSGFTSQAMVPHRFAYHAERYGVVGDKGFDFWVENSPFLLTSSQDTEVVHQQLKIMMKLLPNTLKTVHQVDLDKEAMVVFVTAPISSAADPETFTRGLAALKQRYERKAWYLEDEHDRAISRGRVLLIPLLVEQKTRRPLFIPAWSDVLE